MISPPEMVDIFRDRIEMADYDLDTAKLALRTELQALSLEAF